MLIIPHNNPAEFLSVIITEEQQILAIITHIEKNRYFPYVEYLDVEMMESKNVELLKYIVENWDGETPLPIWCDINNIRVSEYWKKINVNSVKKVHSNYKLTQQHKPKVRKRRIQS